MKNATKEQIENAPGKLDAAKKALKKDTTPDTEKPDTDTGNKSTGCWSYNYCKRCKICSKPSPQQRGGTAEAVKVIGKGKKITIAATVKIDGVDL